MSAHARVPFYWFDSAATNSIAGSWLNSPATEQNDFSDLSSLSPEQLQVAGPTCNGTTAYLGVTCHIGVLA